jgi:hypothetical protein
VCDIFFFVLLGILSILLTYELSILQYVIVMAGWLWCNIMITKNIELNILNKHGIKR